MAESIKRMKQLQGAKADMPTLLKGEFGFCDDVDELYIGNGTANIEIAKKSQVDSLEVATANAQKYIGDNSGRIKAVDTSVSMFSVDLIKTAISRAKTITGANMIHLTIEFDLPGATGDTFTPQANNANLPEILDYCNQIGIDTSVRCHIGGSGVSNKTVNPTNVATWFANWKEVLLGVASVCDEHNCRYLGIENELLLMTRDENKENWQGIHDAIKAAYPNIQTYFSASIEEYELGCCLVGITDINGINLYPLMTRNGLNETDDNLRAAWVGGYNGRDYIKPLVEMKTAYPNKPVWVIETGCGATSTALQDPARSDLWASAEYSVEVQEKYYQILFEVLWKSTIDGMGLWAVGNNTAFKGYSFQYHPAESIVAANWKEV